MGVPYTATKEKGLSEKNVQHHQLVERITTEARLQDHQFVFVVDYQGKIKVFVSSI